MSAAAASADAAAGRRRGAAAALALAAALSVAAGPAAPEPPERRMLTAQEAAAWRGVGRVNIAGRRFCTGALIDARHVLTAAHCLFNPATGRRTPDTMLTFVAGERVGRRAAHQRVAAAVTPPGYRFRDSGVAEAISRDVALLRLAGPIPDRVATHLPVGVGTAGPLTMVSYARDRAHAPSIAAPCPVTRRQGRVLEVGCAVLGGASGAPLLRRDATGAWRIVAIVSARGRASDGTSRTLAVAVDALTPALRAALPGPTPSQTGVAAEGGPDGA